MKGELKLECQLLNDDDLVSFLLPEGVEPMKLGIEYGEWLNETFYDFCKP